MDKKSLINQIRVFSIPDFPDLHILSKSFFNELFLKSYENKGMYTILYGDINGLRKLNDDIGIAKADLAIKELLKTILNTLPKNTISFRVGGDEFCFVIPDLSTTQTRELTKDIHTNLLSDSKVHGLDITFAACDSSEFDNIQDMYTFAESKVNLKKNSHLHLVEDADDIKDYNEKLDRFIDFTIKTYIKNFRFSSERYFTRDDLRTLSYPILNSITTLLNSETTVINSTTKESTNENPSKIKPETLETLYNLIINEDTDSETLATISDEDLEYIKNSLSIDSITNAYNSVYKEHYLLEELEKNNTPIQIIFAESLGIKISNSVLTHTGTDSRIKYTYNNLFHMLNELIPEDSETEIIPIHSGGGRFEFIIPNNADAISYDALQNIFSEINSDDTNFHILGILGNCPDISKYDVVHSKLDKICELKKDRIKRKSDYFLNSNALKLIDVSLASLVNYFKAQSQRLGIYDEQEKITFSKKVLNSLIDNFNELNLDNAEIGER